MVNLNQILLNFFPPPPYLFTDAERITDSCLPFRKKQLSHWRKTTIFENTSLGYFRRQIVFSEHYLNMRTPPHLDLVGPCTGLSLNLGYCEKPTDTQRA